LGTTGGFLAIMGVVVLPITSGDTAFRSARLIISEAARVSQRPVLKRLFIAVPLFASGFILTQVDFGVMWRYFGWSNQTLATLVLWTSAFYLARQGSRHWIATIPATFLTAVIITFICYSPIGFNLEYPISVTLGIIFAIAVLFSFLLCIYRLKTF
jgi:carbon starvation protein CstA